MARPITVGICTSALRSNIKAFIAKVSSLTNVTVRFIELPYNDLDSFRLSSEGLDGVIICYSINNHRFASTDVMESLYDKFLLRIKQAFDHFRIKDDYMESFYSKQPTTFECCNLAMICGRLDQRVDMDEGDWKQLQVFVLHCNEAAIDSPLIRRNVKVFIFYMALLFAVFSAAMFLLVAIIVKVYCAFGFAGVLLFLIPLICKLYHSYSRDQGAELLTNYGFVVIVVAVMYLLFLAMGEVYRVI